LQQNGLLVLICSEVVYMYFPCCLVCQYQSSDWLWRQPPKWPRLCRVAH